MRLVALASALADRLRPWSPLVLRLAVGLVFLHHGWMKLRMGLDGVTGFLGSLGFPVPGVWAALLVVLETLGAACVVAGLFTRLWAALLAAEMAIALAVAVLPAGRSPELEALLLAACLALVGVGDGPLAVGALFRKRTP